MTKSKLKPVFAVIVTLISTSACTTTNFGKTGLAPSAKTGADNTPSTDLLKALDGGLITRLRGRNLSRTDRLTALQSEYRALEYTAPGEAVLWRGDTLSGQIVPSQPYRVGSQDCRQYEQIITDRAAQSNVKGTACRNEDGSWSLLS